MENNTQLQTAPEQGMSIQNIESFTERLNRPPVDTEIKINEAANNSKYLPVSYVEMELDEIFLGLWSTENFRWSVMANEVVGAIDLLVYHPVARVWIKRTGAAAVMIQQKSEKNGGTGDIADIGQKIKNTLVKDFPHLETECIKSAAKKLGKVFGRDLNRKFEDSYVPVYTQESELSEDTEAIKEKLALCKDLSSLQAAWEWYGQYHENAVFKKMFAAQKRKIQLSK